jgi:hypothetical protein
MTLEPEQILRFSGVLARKARGADGCHHLDSPCSIWP